MALVSAVLLCAAPVAAQETFKQVWVTQADSGEVIRGRIVELSRESMALLTPDNRRVELPIDRVLRIETRGDSLKNGAAIGAAVMGGMVLLACHESGCLPFVATDVAVGAVLGAGIDALNGGRTAIYIRPATAATSRKAAVQFKLRF